MPQKVKSLLGLSFRAGKVVAGENMVKELFKGKKKINMLILASDASLRTKEEFIFRSKRKQIILKEVGNKSELGEAIGKGERAIIAIMDGNLALSIKKAIETEEK